MRKCIIYLRVERSKPKIVRSEPKTTIFRSKVEKSEPETSEEGRFEPETTSFLAENPEMTIFKPKVYKF